MLGLVAILGRSLQFWRERARFIPACHLHAGKQIDIAVTAARRRLTHAFVSHGIRTRNPNSAQLLSCIIFVPHARVVALTCLVRSHAGLARRLDIEMRNWSLTGNVNWLPSMATVSRAIFMRNSRANGELRSQSSKD